MLNMREVYMQLAWLVIGSPCQGLTPRDKKLGRTAQF
jgi:hypothetical protein